MVLVLDTRNRVIHQETLYTGHAQHHHLPHRGGVRLPMRHHAAAIIVAHNHPSGDPNPSPEDVALTRRLVEAGKLMEIDVLDHVVIGQNRYVSACASGRWDSRRHRRRRWTL